MDGVQVLKTAALQWRLDKHNHRVFGAPSADGLFVELIARGRLFVGFYYVVVAVVLSSYGLHDSLSVLHKH